MKWKPLAALALFSLISCGGPIEKEPTRNEFIGLWQALDFPKGFLKEAGISTSVVSSQIEIYGDGSCSTIAFPQRKPYRLANLKSKWALVAPPSTPSNTWSLEFDNNFLQFRKEDGELLLRYTISGKDHYYVDYRRVNSDQTR